MQTERIDLYYQQGSSDKVYHLQLENVEEQWSVNAQWGRRGSTLQSDTKASGVPYEEAKRVSTACCGKRRARATAWPKAMELHPRRFRSECRRRSSPATHLNC